MVCGVGFHSLDFVHISPSTLIFCPTRSLPGPPSPADFDALADELRGKDPHARIRTAAREALEAMFDSTPATRE